MDIKICKAKSKATNDWVYGYPVEYHDKTVCIIDANDINRTPIPVISETLCYTTGECDKNGRELFFGDTINDFYGGFDDDHMLESEDDVTDYMARQIIATDDDNTRFGNIVLENGTTRIQTLEMDYAYNISDASKLSDMEYVCNIWDAMYPKIVLQDVWKKIIESQETNIITTKDKTEFMLSEMKHYDKNNFDEFKEHMDGICITCDTCGVYYWMGCKKRCSCA